MMNAGVFILSNKIRSVILLPIFFVLSGCGLTQIAPIQTGRIAQLETFRHTFYFGKSNSLGSDSDINRKIDTTFKKLLGETDWRTIKDNYGFRDIKDELVAKSIYVKGLAQFYITIDPYDHQQFLLEGTGKYYLIRQKTNSILLLGDFIAPPTTFKISDLNNGLLSINVNLYTTTIPGEITHTNGSIVKYQIKFDKSRKQESINRIDYRAINDVHIVSSLDEPLTDDNKLGELIFDNQEQSSKKLLDLRGIQFLRTDY